MVDRVATDEELSLYSDLHKDVVGMRPRSFDFETREDFEAEMNYLREELVREEARREEAERRNLQEWSDRINEICSFLNADRRDVIRWDMQAHGLETDPDQYFWEQGLGWSDIQTQVKEWKQ